MSEFAFTGSFAEVYDRYLVPMDFAPHARRMAERISALAPRLVLETAAGTGVVTRELARILPAGAMITATDLNEPMLALAQASIRDTRVHWRLADALDLPFAAQAFEVVLCQFGVMFFADKQRGFREACRVLQPGGHFIFSVWDSFEANASSPLRIAARVVGSVIERDPVSLLSPPYCDDRIIESDLAGAGFENPRVERVTEPSRAASADAAAAIVCQGSALRAAIERHAPARMAEITEKVSEVLSSRFGSGPVEGVTQAVLVTAERPHC